MVDLFLYFCTVSKITRDFLFLQYFQSIFLLFIFLLFFYVPFCLLNKLTKAKRYYRIRQRSIKDGIPSAYEKCESTTKDGIQLILIIYFLFFLISVIGVFRNFPHFPLNCAHFNFLSCFSFTFFFVLINFVVFGNYFSVSLKTE